MKTLLALMLLSGICAAQEDQQPAEPPKTIRLKIAYFSNSQLASEEGQPKRFCEGNTDDLTSRKNGKPLKSDEWSINPEHRGERPRMVALHRMYKAIGCTLKFTSGP